MQLKKYLINISPLCHLCKGAKYGQTLYIPVPSRDRNDFTHGLRRHAIFGVLEHAFINTKVSSSTVQ